jgi:hypothetical protein
MGILTDFFIATRRQAESINLARGPSEHFPTHHGKWIDPVKLAKLYKIVLKKQGAKGQHPIRVDRDGEVLLFEVPLEVIESLAALDDAGAARVRDTWFATEEFAHDRWDRPGLEEWFTGFRNLLCEAAREKRGVYLWLSV